MQKNQVTTAIPQEEKPRKIKGAPAKPTFEMCEMLGL